MNVFAGNGCNNCGVENLIPPFFGAVLGVFIGPKLIISGWSDPPGVFTQQTYSGSAAWVVSKERQTELLILI
jgi:hypothetical protein